MSSRGGWIVAGIATLAVLLINPLAELSWNDDWCYGRMAYEFARSGKLIYNGWAAAMVGPQALWGALWIKLFGFSLTTLRLSTLPIFMGCCLLLHSLHRRAGVREELSLFGSLAIVFSPIVLPLATSFMTDIFGLFLFLLTIQSALNALQSPRERALLWIGAVVLVGLAAGAIRQIFWLLPLVALGYTAWRKADRRVAAATGAGIALVGAAALSVWYSKQPLALSESVVPGIKGIVHNPVPSLLNILGLLMGVTLFLLPVVSGYVGQTLGQMPRNARLGLVVGAVVLTGICLWQSWLFPWSFNICSEFGVLRPSDTILGDPTLVLGTVPRAVLSLVALLSSLVVLSVAWQQRRELLAPLRRNDEVVVLLALYGLPYLAVALSRAGIGMSWDRYLIPIFPLVTILTLRSLGDRPLPRIFWGVLALFGSYSIAVSHDYLAFLRAEASAIQTLQKRGIPNREIRANFEFDCWTELDLSGYFNDPRIHNPADAYKNITDEQMRGLWPSDQKVPWWWRFTPSVQGRYFISTTPIPGLENTPDPPVTYQRWLPFQQASVRILQKPESN